jgi:hypothetical protein
MTRNFLKAVGVTAIALAAGSAGQQTKVTQDSD